MKAAAMFMLFFLGGYSFAQSAQVITHTSPNGIVEECKILPQFPGADYSKGDLEEERELCQLDFYNDPKLALCPKTWSTSPGTMIYDISESNFSQQEYENQKACGGSKSGHETITKFKQSMNQKGTSGTFSPSSLLYYHLSRYFDTAVDAPVSVYRSMDRAAHYERVTQKAHENRMGKGPMIRAGWKWMYDSLRDPSVYRPTNELFNADLNQIFGVLGHNGGERYGAEINGVRSAWGDRQNYDFQKTPAFLALSSEKPLIEAIAEGLDQGQRNSKVRAAMGGGASNFQMAVWMKEISEIVILDYILNQQDRIGNIDFVWNIFWINNKGKVKSKRVRSDLPREDMSRIDYPKEMDGVPTQLVQRTRINDNDAGGKASYSNFTKRTKMLEKIRHMDKKAFDRLQSLNQDLQNQGPIYQLMKSQFTLDEKELNEIVSNTKEAAEILAASEREGKLQFDLDSVKKMFEALN